MIIPATSASVAVGKIPSSPVAPVADGLCPGMSRVFSLRFAWQLEQHFRDIVELPDELMCIVPVDFFNGPVFALEMRGVRVHDLLPLRLSYLRLRKPESLNFGGVMFLSKLLLSLLLVKNSHCKSAGRYVEELDSCERFDPRFI